VDALEFVMRAFGLRVTVFFFFFSLVLARDKALSLPFYFSL
jgi:hypothetical protein